MKEAGVDVWQAQIDSQDGLKSYEDCGDDLIMESYPVVPDGLHGAELEKYIHETMEAFCIRHRGLLDFYDFDPERWPETRRLIYKAGRELAEQQQGK